MENPPSAVGGWRWSIRSARAGTAAQIVNQRQQQGVYKNAAGSVGRLSRAVQLGPTGRLRRAVLQQCLFKLGPTGRLRRAVLQQCLFKLGPTGRLRRAVLQQCLFLMDANKDPDRPGL